LFSESFESSPYVGYFTVQSQTDGTLFAQVVIQRPVVNLDNTPPELLPGVPDTARITQELVVAFVRQDGSTVAALAKPDSANSLVFTAPYRATPQSCRSIRLERHFVQAS
jgi:hypothetical protein